MERKLVENIKLKYTIHFIHIHVHVQGSMAIPVCVSIHSKKEATLVKAACIPISQPRPEPKLVIPICLYFPSSYRYSSGPPESPCNYNHLVILTFSHFSGLTLQVEIPFLPEMQMLFLLMFKGNSRAQARLVMVSTVASLKTGLMLSDWSVGFPAAFSF